MCYYCFNCCFKGSLIFHTGKNVKNKGYEEDCFRRSSVSRRKKAFWSKKPEEPKNPELAAEKQLPRESLKHQQLEKLLLKGQGVPA